MIFYIIETKWLCNMIYSKHIETVFVSNWVDREPWGKFLSYNVLTMLNVSKFVNAEKLLTPQRSNKISLVKIFPVFICYWYDESVVTCIIQSKWKILFIE